MAAIAAAVAAKMVLDEIKSKVKETFDGIKTIISGTVQALTDTFQSLKTQMFDSVSLYRPFAVIQFNRALMDLHAVFGQMMLPTVRDLTSIVRNLADAFFSMPQGIKDAISAFVKIGLVLGGFASIIGPLGAVGAALAALIAPFAFMAIALPVIGIPLAAIAAAFAAMTVCAVGALAALVQFTRMLINTAGGQRLLANLNKAWDQLMAGFKAAIAFIQNAIAPAWDALNDALSSFGDSLSELLEALKPLAAGIIVVGAVALTIAFNLIAQGLTWITKQLSTFARFLGRTFGMLFGGMPKLPEGEERKSSFGLGWSSGAVLDPNTMYNKITEELLKASRGPDAQTQSAGHLADISQATKQIQAAMTNALIYLQAIAQVGGKAIGGAFDLAGVAANPIGSAIQMIP